MLEGFYCYKKSLNEMGFATLFDAHVGIPTFYFYLRENPSSSRYSAASG